MAKDKRSISGSRDRGTLKTFAIIGHGRSPEGRGWGPRIDACTVLRMWDWSRWQAPADYGVSYDYGFFEAHPQMMATFYENLQCDPSIGWVASALGEVEKCVLPPRTEIVRQEPWNEIGKALGGVGATGRLQFTRGTIAACWAIERAETGEEIVLVGFDNIRAGQELQINQAFSPAYRKNPGTFSFAGYRGGVTKNGNHDFAVEKPVLEYLAAQRGVKLSFAQDVWC